MMKEGNLPNQRFISPFIIAIVIANHIATKKTCHIFNLNGPISIHISKSHASTCFGTIIFIFYFYFIINFTLLYLKLKIMQNYQITIQKYFNQ